MDDEHSGTWSDVLSANDGVDADTLDSLATPRGDGLRVRVTARDAPGAFLIKRVLSEAGRTSEWQNRATSANEDHYERVLVETQHYTSAQVWGSYLWSAAITHPKVSEMTLLRWAKNVEAYSAAIVEATRQRYGGEARLAGRAVVDVLLIRGSQFPSVLQELLAHKGARPALARNPSTPPDILASLARSRESDVRRILAARPDLPQDVWDRLARDDRFDVRRALRRSQIDPKVRSVAAQAPQV